MTGVAVLMVHSVAYVSCACVYLCATGGQHGVQVMEIREEASDTEDKDELLRLAEQNLQRRTAYAERIRDAYSGSEFQLMIKLVQELTYFHRIEQLIRDKL